MGQAVLNVSRPKHQAVTHKKHSGSTILFLGKVKFYFILKIEIVRRSTKSQQHKKKN